MVYEVGGWGWGDREAEDTHGVRGMVRRTDVHTRMCAVKWARLVRAPRRITDRNQIEGRRQLQNASNRKPQLL